MPSVEIDVTKINKAFNPSEHLLYVHTEEFKGKALCIFCGYSKPVEEFPRKWQNQFLRMGGNPHRTGGCTACKRPEVQKKWNLRKKPTWLRRLLTWWYYE